MGLCWVGWYEMFAGAMLDFSHFIGRGAKHFARRRGQIERPTPHYLGFAPA